MPETIHTLFAAASYIFALADPDQVAAETLRLCGQDLMHNGETDLPSPVWPEALQLVTPKHVPKRKITTNPESRAMLLHAIAHIEYNAIHLALDIAVRFSDMPVDFTRDWLHVAAEEAKHFRLLQARLRALGTAYGDVSAHAGLWEAAEATAHDVAARLAIVPMVLEARGLDVTPGMIEKFKAVGDVESVAALDVIYREEIGHVEKGVRWFNWVAEQRGREPESYYQELVRRYFRGVLKPPFNDPARAEAGLMEEYYRALV